MPSWADVVALGTRHPGVEESTWYGTPALKIGGKGFCRLRTDPDALVVRVSDGHEKEALLQDPSGAFFSTPHYDETSYVLVDLERVDPGLLAELIEDAARLRSEKRQPR